ncbi:MAG: signal peptide peptidase SppA [Magnetospirillum sp. WYHS-4]
MTLEADLMIDRRRLKRRLIFWRILAIAALVGGAVALAKPDHGDVGLRPYVARLDVSGVIVSDPERDEALDDLARSDRVKALVVRIDSPGGTVVGGESLYRGLRRVAAKKPVVAVMRETAASAAYMTALAADHLVAHEGTVTGSIGVLLQHADMTSLLDKLGVKPESIKSAPLKAQPNPLEPLTEEARAAAKAVVLDMYGMFVDMVAERRGLDRKAALGLADGRVFTGRQAKAEGLVDRLGGEPEARTWLSEAHGIKETVPVHDVEIERKDGLWREFLDKALGKSWGSSGLRLDGLVSVWHPVLH